MFKFSLDLRNYNILQGIKGTCYLHLSHDLTLININETLCFCSFFHYLCRNNTSVLIHTFLVNVSLTESLD